MRNFIRTSHDQRRRSSAAATAEQLAYLAAFNEQRPGSLPVVDSVKMAGGDIRRSSITGDMAGMGGKGGMAGTGGAGPESRRRGSLTGSAAAGALGVGCGGSSSPLLQGGQRRRWNADRKPLNRLDTCDMEIRQTSILAIVLIVCAGCLTVVLLAYALKSYL